jgi:hypothetical protein
MGLSAPVEAAVDQAVSIVASLVGRFSVEEVYQVAHE